MYLLNVSIFNVTSVHTHVLSYNSTCMCKIEGLNLFFFEEAAKFFKSWTDTTTYVSTATEVIYKWRSCYRVFTLEIQQQ